jgi:hypothetical protein
LPRRSNSVWSASTRVSLRPRSLQPIDLWLKEIAPSDALRRQGVTHGAKVALGFTPYSGQPNKGLTEMLTAAGFQQANVVERDNWFCALALNQ